MLFSSFALLFAASSTLAAPVPSWKREVPQEHSHEDIIRAVRNVLFLNNPDNIVDPVFGLLGNAAASTGAGNINDPDCLQQATADQAFSNAKAAGDIAGMTVALQYRAIERNTGQVGLASVICSSIPAVNPEIAAITQHQDPASPNAAAINKGIVLELARQIAAIGGNPLDALKTGTFSPGQIGDPTAKGNSCNDENDANGCINTLGLLVLDATEEEILAAVGGGADNDAPDAAVDCPPDVTVTVTPVAPAPTEAAESAATCPPEVTVTVTVTAPAPTETAESADNANNADGNFQKFTGALGGIPPPAVTVGGRGFAVENNASFPNLASALTRSCDVHKNQCANAANSGAPFSVGDCERQANECRALI